MGTQSPGFWVGALPVFFCSRSQIERACCENPFDLSTRESDPPSSHSLSIPKNLNDRSVGRVDKDMLEQRLKFRVREGHRLNVKVGKRAGEIVRQAEQLVVAVYPGPLRNLKDEDLSLSPQQHRPSTARQV
jgi:hypothetical protein